MLFIYHFIVETECLIFWCVCFVVGHLTIMVLRRLVMQLGNNLEISAIIMRLWPRRSNLNGGLNLRWL